MALETASYVANLVITNPDGADQRSTVDDHIRLIKACMVRTFPKFDGAISLSQTQISYVGDLSASAQAQLNTLRDGPGTANYAIYANSASVAAYVGSIPATNVLQNHATIDMDNGVPEAMRINAAGGFISWYVSGVRQGYIQYVNGAGLLISVEQSHSYRISVNGAVRQTINPDGTVTIPGLITGTITQAQNATSASFAANCTTAVNAITATNAGTATFANTCTSASSAALLSNMPADAAATGSTIAARNSAGYLFANYFNQSSAAESPSVGHVLCMTNLDGYHRVVPVATVGQYLEARNVTGKSGTAKTLASGSGPPSLSGSTNGDIFYYY